MTTVSSSGPSHGTFADSLNVENVCHTTNGLLFGALSIGLANANDTAEVGNDQGDPPSPLSSLASQVEPTNAPWDVLEDFNEDGTLKALEILASEMDVADEDGMLDGRRREWSEVPPLIDGPAHNEVLLPEVRINQCQVIYAREAEPKVVICERSGRVFLLIRVKADCTYGCIYDAVEARDRQLKPILPLRHFSVKQLDLKMIADNVEKLKKNPFQDISATSWLRHEGAQNVLFPVETVCDDMHMYIITPLMQNGDLKDVMAPPAFGNAGFIEYSEEAAKPLFRQILSAIDYCHRRAICHHDIALENTVVNADGDACYLTDFGLSCHMPYADNERYIQKWDHRLGKPYCRAANMGRDYDGIAADVFAAASVLFTMLTSTLPYQAPLMCDPLYYELIHVKDLSGRLARMRVNISAAAQELIMLMYTGRYTAAELLRHRWFIE